MTVTGFWQDNDYKYHKYNMSVLTRDEATDLLDRLSNYLYSKLKRLEIKDYYAEIIMNDI